MWDLVTGLMMVRGKQQIWESINSCKRQMDLHFEQSMDALVVCVVVDAVMNPWQASVVGDEARG